MILWGQFTRSGCFPDCSCEYMQIDSWINQPIAFWSSLAYLLPIYFLNRNLKEKTELTGLWNLCLVVLTISSMFCHASFIRLSVAMDFACIGILMGFFLVAHFFKGKKLYWALALFFVAQILINFTLGKWEKIAICIVIYLAAFYELIQSKGKHFYKEKNLQLSIFILTVSFLLFLIDDQKLAFCDPHGWIHGHTLWHFGTAWSAYYYARWRFIDEKIS
jgi:hypothetical protein